MFRSVMVATSTHRVPPGTARCLSARCEPAVNLDATTGPAAAGPR